MMMYTKQFNKLSKKDVSLAGGKGASLGELAQLGFIVPEGFVILTGAFDKFLEENGIGIKIEDIFKKINQQDMPSVEHASEKIQALFLNTKVPDDIKKEIEISFEKLGAEFVAVRSSATAEDSSVDSWAGELESYTNIGEEKLFDAIKRCWASLFTPRAIFYRFEKEMDNNHIAVAVVVQKMVQSEVSGIAFTMHPVKEDYNQILIEAGYGLGEAIVSGMITPDSYVVNKKDIAIEGKNISKQKMMIVHCINRNEEKIVPFEKQEEQKISDEKIVELAKICINIEKHYGFPCDIEWALEDGKLYIMQSRPITTLTSVSKDKAEAELGFDNKREIILDISNCLYERYVKFPEIPVLFFEATCNCYVNNPYFSQLNLNDSYPNLISVLDEHYEAWQDRSRRIIITENDKIKEIIDNCLFIAKKHEPYLHEYIERNSLASKEKLGQILLKLNFISTEIYQQFIFFTDECFQTNDPDLLKLLPHVRMQVSNSAISLLFNCFEKLLSQISKITDVATVILNRLTTDEILSLLDKKIFKKDVDKRPIVFVTKDNNLSVYFGNDAKKIHGALLENNPENILINTVTENRIIEGISANKGIVKGEVLILEARDYSKAFDILAGKKDFVLVTPMTRPELLPILKEAIAIITDEGGITCHAAIVARELKKPCIIGTKIATQVLRDGDLVEVDGDNGIIKIINVN